MADIIDLKPSGVAFPQAQGPRCLFCGSGKPWFDALVTGERDAKPGGGCDCRWATAVRVGKEFQLIDRSGKLVVTKCSSELWKPLIWTGLLVGGLKAVMGKELPDESKQAMRAAVIAYRALHGMEIEHPSAKTEQSPVIHGMEIEHPAQNQADEIGPRAQKRERILARILSDPAKSDKALAQELQVSRNTVAAIRKMVDDPKETE